MKFIKKYINDFKINLSLYNLDVIDNLVKNIIKIKKNKGRIFFIGVGGSAGNASHAVNDFRKLCSIECYNPLDNISEFSARANDEGWENTIYPYLKISKLSKKDCIFIFSVGGGNKKKNVSVNLVKSIDYAKSVNAKVLGIVGKNDGYAAKNSDCCFILPETKNKDYITPFSETAQPLIWHLIVSHPNLKDQKTKW